VINSIKQSAGSETDQQRSEVLEKIMHQYERPEEKQREAVKKLGKDEFFKIMVTQIQHQDPLKPYQNEDMAAQMAQFSSLEQMLNMNQNLEKLTQSQQPLHNLGAANLIGKQVTTDSSRVMHTQGKYSNVSFELPSDVKSATVFVLNGRGETVSEIERKDLKKFFNNYFISLKKILF
jgi:flagellar basal-body rod modification protein FlgD